MNLSFDFLMQLADSTAAKHATKPDVLWCVTAFRANVYALLIKMGLTQPDGHYPGVDLITEDIKNVVKSYVEVIATFPKEIRYSDEKVEQPRANAINEALKIYEGLQSDEKSWESAQELTRLVATNEDSQNQQKITYDILMGVAMRIMSLMSDINIMGICADLI